MIIDRFRTLLAALAPTVVEAHCDTADGPAVTAGRAALETGDLNPALVWIPADDEAELREVFDQARSVRSLGPVAARVADRLFLETLVRLHRMAEGVGFTGIQPAGTAVDPVVAAADRAISTGSDDALLALVPPERRHELHARFRAARALHGADPDDVAAGRRYLAAYVAFVGYAEGEEHGHADHEHAEHEPAEHDPAGREHAAHEAAGHEHAGPVPLHSHEGASCV